jgi:hypothetical protein
LERVANYKYECTVCKFDTSNKKDYNRHLTTIKHKNLLISQQNSRSDEKKTRLVSCASCRKEYASRSGMWYHLKHCKGSEPDTEVNLPTASPMPSETNAMMFEFMRDRLQDNFDQSQLVNELVKQNSELKSLMIEQNKHMLELINKVGNTICQPNSSV